MKNLLSVSTIVLVSAALATGAMAKPRGGDRPTLTCDTVAEAAETLQERTAAKLEKVLARAEERGYDDEKTAALVARVEAGYERKVAKLAEIAADC